MTNAFFLHCSGILSLAQCLITDVNTSTGLRGAIKVDSGPRLLATYANWGATYAEYDRHKGCRAVQKDCKEVYEARLNFS